MSTRPLSRLLDADMVERLRLHDIITSSDLFEASSLQLMGILDLGLNEIASLMSSVAEKLAPRPATGHKHPIPATS